MMIFDSGKAELTGLQRLHLSLLSISTLTRAMFTVWSGGSAMYTDARLLVELTCLHPVKIDI
jgi:hypothetical protein